MILSSPSSLSFFRSSNSIHPSTVMIPVNLMIKKSNLRWFGHVEREDDNDWVKRCMMREGIRQRGCLKNTWWDCVKDNMESLGLSQKDDHFRNKWSRRIKWATG